MHVLRFQNTPQVIKGLTVVFSYEISA